MKSHSADVVATVAMRIYWTASWILIPLLVSRAASAMPTRYFYDDLNRLVRVERADCAVVTYTYDALGNRLSKTVITDRDCDGTRDALDCAPADPTAWAVPGEATDLLFSDPSVMVWSAPAILGGTAVHYDVLRSNVASDFSTPACVAKDIAPTTATDPGHPSPGAAVYYLVRSKNVCGGNLGNRSDGTARVGGTCP